VNASSEQYFETDYKCGNLVSGRCREGRGEAMMKMPVVFVGHGSPMNAIEDNNYTRGWRKMAQRYIENDIKSNKGRYEELSLQNLKEQLNILFSGFDAFVSDIKFSSGGQKP
jgi:hypothetical protein